MQGINAAIDYTLSGMMSGGFGNPVAAAQAPLPIIESGLYAKTADMVSNVSLGVWGDVLVPWEASPFWSGSYHPDVDSFVKTRLGKPRQLWPLASASPGTISAAAAAAIESHRRQRRWR